MKKNKRTFPIFWMCFALFVFVMAIFWICVTGNVKKSLAEYESSQPERLLETIVSQIENGNIDKLVTIDDSENRFEDAKTYYNDYIHRVNDRTITFEKDLNSYDAKNPVYKIYADDCCVAYVTLHEVSSENILLILTKQNWELSKIEPVVSTGNKEVTIVAPDSYSVFVNGIKVDSREKTAREWEIKEFEYAAEYVAVPKLVEYHVEGLLNEPEVMVFDNMGREVSYTVATDGRYTVSEYFPSDFPEGIEDMALKNAKDYSNFFSRDLEGCRASVAPLQGMFPENSYYLKLADNYRNNDMWMYSAHEAPQFEDERVSNYIYYTPEFFSCEVYFKKNMKLTLNGEQRTDITNTRYYYVKVDDRWVVADMKAVVE